MSKQIIKTKKPDGTTEVRFIGMEKETNAKELTRAKEMMKPSNIVRGAVGGTLKDLRKFTTGIGKGGAATKILSDTGYMLKGAVKNIIKRGETPQQDYSEWNENIKKGTPEENLKLNVKIKKK